MNTQLNSITVNGEIYVRQDSYPSGNRHVVVVDRGWIWAGDLSIKEMHGQTFYMLSNAVHVWSWNEIGFTGVLANPNSNKVKLKESTVPVVIPMNSVISLHPVNSDWGVGK